MGDAMKRVEHQLQQFRGAPGQGAIVKQALQTFYDEIQALKNAPAMSCTCAELGTRVAAIELVMAGPPDDEPVALPQVLQREPEGPAEQCPPAALAVAVLPIVVPALVQGAVKAAATMSSEAAAPGDAVAGHYSVETSPNGPPVLPLHSTEEGSSEDIEAILLQAEATQVDRFLSLAQHQKVLGEKVRKATAARNRRTAAKKAAIP
jgi:hypothetical protein